MLTVVFNNKDLNLNEFIKCVHICKQASCGSLVLQIPEILLFVKLLSSLKILLPSL